MSIRRQRKVLKRFQEGLISEVRQNSVYFAFRGLQSTLTRGVARSGGLKMDTGAKPAGQSLDKHLQGQPK